MFPLNNLIHYLLLENFDEDIKATLYKLITYIYIDKEPRIFIRKPNLVKVFEKDDLVKEKQEMAKEYYFKTFSQEDNEAKELY